MITNEEQAMKLEYYYNRGILKQEIRSYEVSLWTLQDEFITVLKWSDVEQKGKIENSKMILNTDGMSEFSFSIPMYIYQQGKLIENPNWYTTRNGNLIESLRKVKIIFNKGEYPKTELSKHVFEFLIINIQEEHVNGILTCNVKCESLAYHELSKIGYKINLSQEDFERDYLNWENTQLGDRPIESLDYWCRKAGLVMRNVSSNSSRQWYYRVEMRWHAYEDGPSRDPSKIYEETYSTAWNANLQPTSYREYTEKARPVKVENSNLYNITQDFAETFGVFCRYEYDYDENYHIIGRNIIFYNNFMAETDGIIGITYPYNSSEVQRIVDSANLTTKLFVLDANGSSDGESYSIMNALPNASHEDYILNFDYLKTSGAITQEQYDEIKVYEKKMRAFNEELIRLQGNLNAYQTEWPDLAAKKTLYENSIKLDTEQLTQNQALANSLDAKDGSADGLISLTWNNPDVLTVVNGIIDFTHTNKGIKASSLSIYDSYDASAKTHGDDEITSYICYYDENGNLEKITGVTAEDSMVYAIYDYNPQLYYDAIAQMWQRKLNADTSALENITAELDTLEDNIESTQSRINELISWPDGEMPIARREFEHLMGPALREGYWQPEDYTDYGDLYSIIKNFNDTSNFNRDTGTDMAVGWDTTLFDGEDKAYYEYGTEGTHKNYICINLNSAFPNGIPINIDAYSLIFNNNYAAPDDEPTAYRNQAYYAVGSQLQLGFIKQGNSNIIPVLIFLGSKNMTTNEISHMRNTEKGRPRLAIVAANTEGIFTGAETNVVSLTNDMWLTSYSDLSIAYPRIKCTSTALKTDTTNLNIWYNTVWLEQYKDYYINMRNTNLGSQSEPKYYMEYFITLKPELFYKYGMNQNILINYVLSNACTAIYLDAKKVSVENAYPKVSYEVKTNVLTGSLSHTLYTKLAQLMTINDTDLKLENVFGYISQVELDLDNPENDTIEVKNYKNKFEDVFASILAQTEAMKYNGYNYSLAATGQLGLSSAGFAKTLANNKEALDTYLDEHFNTSEEVQQTLTSLFTEASNILASAQSGLDRLGGLTQDNAGILNGFVQNVAEELTSKVFRQEFKPEVFKRGDIWIRIRHTGTTDKIIGRYIATANSSDLQGTSDVGSDTSGFVRTYDGTLASITGANLNIDTVAGTVDVEAQNYVNIKSGKNIYIAADGVVDIVGGEKVNIGGTEINLCSMNVKERDEDGLLINKTENGAAIVKETTGINLIAGVYSFNASTGKYTGGQAHVLITPKKITMGASELRLMAASKINLLVSTGNKAGTSSILLDANKGIYVGSGAGIRLYSGTATPEVYVGPTHKAAFNKGDYWIQTSSVSNRYEYSEENSNYYANIIIDETQYPTNMGFDILNLWIADNRWDEYYSDDGLSPENGTQGWTAQTGTARATAIEWIKSYRAEGATVELNKEHLMFGFNEVTKNSSDGSMMEFTKEYIVLGVGATNRSLRVTGVSGGLTGVKITNQSIGMAVTNAAILMDDNGVTVGSGINLTSGTNTLKGIAGSYVRVAPGGVYIGSSGELYIDTTNFLIDSHATGTNNIFALRNGGTNYLTYSISNGLWVHGQIQSESFVATGNNGKFMADGSHFGLYDTNGTAILTINSSSLVVGSNYTLSVGGNLSINSTNLVVNPAASGNETLFKAMNGTNGIIVEGDGDTTVTGIINATGGRFINDIYVDGTIHGGTITGGIITGGTITGGSITIINDNTNNGTVTIGSGDNIFTFDQSGNLTVHGALTATSLTVGDGTYLSYSSSTGLNIGSGGLTYTTSGGLIVTGKIHANELWITDLTNNTEQSATDWVNAKVTPEAIWLGVVKHTTNNANATIASQSHIALSDDSIAIDSSGSINLNGASLTLTSSGSNVISMTTSGIALNGGTISLTSGQTSISLTPSTLALVGSTMTLDASSSLSLTSGNTRISLSSSSFSLTGASILVNAIGVGEVVAINSYGIGITSASFMVNSGSIILDANSSISITSGGSFSVSTNNFNINSSASGNSYVISCGDGTNTNFAVDASGGVTLKKLYVDGVPVNFTTAFSNAVTIQGTCSGETLSCSAKFYNNNSLVKTAGFTAAATAAAIPVNAAGISYGVGKTTINISFSSGITGTLSISDVTINAPGIAANAANIVKSASDRMVDSCQYSSGDTIYTPNGIYQYGDADWRSYANTAHTVTAAISAIAGGYRAYARIDGTTVDYADASTCFAAGTPILLTDGTTVPIEKVQLDMEVMAYDEYTKEYLPTWVQVVQKITGRPMEVFDIYLNSGDILTATSSHPILTERGWCACNAEWARREHDDVDILDDLQIGDRVYSPLYDNIYIERIVRREDLDTIPVYHLNMEPTDTYVAGGIVVHNDESGDSGGTK